MRLQSKLPAPAGTILFFLLLAFSHGATITGTVKGPDGGPFNAVFVEAQDAKTTMVLSDIRGHYRVGHLPAGGYSRQLRAVGQRTESPPS